MYRMRSHGGDSVNIDQLRYFADLAKTKSMNTTAKKMFISQPALSESIKRLEEDLGCTLLHRSKTGITFTEDGKMVLEHALRILEHHDQIRHNLQIKYDQEHIYGKLVIGVGPTINDTFLPDLLLKMHQLHPHISLSVLATTFDAMSTLLTNGIIDVGLAGIHQTEALTFAQTYMQNDHIFYVEKLFTDPMVCVMEKSHPLSIHDTLTVEQIATQKQTIYGNDASYISSIGALHISTNAKVHQQFMKNANTICSMPYHAYLSLYPQDDFIYRPIADAEPITTYFICNHTTKAENPELYQAFINIVTSITQEKNTNFKL